MGLSLARVVLEKGCRAVLTTRSITKAQETAPDIEKKGGKWVQLAFSDENLEEIIKDAIKRWEVDVIVNNAGYAVVGPVENLRCVLPPPSGSRKSIEIPHEVPQIFVHSMK